MNDQNKHSVCRSRVVMLSGRRLVIYRAVNQRQL